MSGEVNDNGGRATDSGVVSHNEVDPEFIYEISVIDPVTKKKIVIAFLMASSKLMVDSVLEYWLLRDAWTNNKPGATSATWTYRPISSSDQAFNEVAYPTAKNPADALTQFRSLFAVENGDLMRKHVVTVLA